MHTHTHINTRIHIYKDTFRHITYKSHTSNIYIHGHSNIKLPHKLLATNRFLRKHPTPTHIYYNTQNHTDIHADTFPNIHTNTYYTLLS